MTIREKFEKSVDKKIISELINIAIATSKIKKIIVEEISGNWDLRTNINIFIYGSIGSTKSVLLNEISKKINCLQPFTDLTYPALIGSIDKLTRQLLIGACWECRNSIMLLDEYNLTKRTKDDIRALLQLIEGGKYNKKLASFSAPTTKKDNDLYYSFENGTFNIKTRFSLILATMKYPYTSQNSEVKAFVSRSIVIPFYPNKQELINVAKGYPIFTYKNLTPKKLEILVKKKDYKIILNYISNRSTELNFLRILGDCVRIFAVLDKHRFDLYDLIIKLGNKKFQSKKPKEK